MQLGDVSSASIERPTLTVTDAEVEKTIEVLRKQRTRYEAADRAAAQRGSRRPSISPARIDGVEFDGGKGTDVAFVLGEGRMLPDFEAGVTGMKPGEIEGLFRVLPGRLSAARKWPARRRASRSP